MIDVVPLSHRARALSTLGGSHRVGVFVGPLLGAGADRPRRPGVGLRPRRGRGARCAAALASTMPDLGTERRDAQRERGHLGVWRVLLAHRRTLLTLGVVVVVISASRSVRNGLLPLWADHVGISASTTSLIFALAGAVDILFFYPGGWLMDHRGRTVVAVPVVLSVAVAAAPAAAGHLRLVGRPGRRAHRRRQRPRLGHRDDPRRRRGAGRGPRAVPRRVAPVRRHRHDAAARWSSAPSPPFAPLAAGLRGDRRARPGRHGLDGLLDPSGGPAAPSAPLGDRDADLVGRLAGVGVEHPEAVLAGRAGLDERRERRRR